MKTKNSRKVNRRNTLRWRTVSGGVTAPQGYLAAGVAAGIKKHGLDLAVIFSSQPAAAAAVFTRNRIQAAPVRVSKAHLERTGGRVRAVLINSGCANACTGEQGMRDAVLSTRTLASSLSIASSEVLVASTGVIGEALPVPRVLRGVEKAVASLNSQGGDAAARAIMTTDTVAKSVSIETRVEGRRVRIGGVAKGSGMIHPDLATMLAVLTTDASIQPGPLRRIFRRVVERTFNCLTVDGDTSTNDMVAFVANGVSGVRVDGSNCRWFEDGLERACEALVKKIARDGEGASKFVEIRVSGAGSFDSARKVAKAIAHSPLVKTALCGEELNWGRILCAAGYSGVDFDPERARLSICGTPVYRKGAAVASMRLKAEKALKGRDIRIGLDLGGREGEAKVWTCDLTRGYVDINASYIS
jgi:glutamate N-acetyltransferase / amino-acid N-acetyltransferase